MDPAYAHQYQALYERHWWWRAREQLILATLRRHRPVRGWGRILDVGCGAGLLFERLAELGDVEGVEADPLLAAAAGKHRDRIHVGPFDASFQPQTRYSLVLMLDVIEHLPDPVAAVAQAVRLLEADGIVVATVPAFRVLWTAHDVLNRHFTRFTKRSFRAVAHAAGLDVLRARYCFHWLFPAKLAVRLAEACIRPVPAPPRVPPPALNALLYGVSRLEQRLLTPLPMPFGSSLLVVGRRPGITK
ncbi:MAG TPA: class I SAM-dependent methyltransferase [Gemmatimonadales bacterium]|nr:class I SAM-dependent methyltransferase [Gemmatimonadales bacterium]